jgi:hypothetical protein
MCGNGGHKKEAKTEERETPGRRKSKKTKVHVGI